MTNYPFKFSFRYLDDSYYNSFINPPIPLPRAEAKKEHAKRDYTVTEYHVNTEKMLRNSTKYISHVSIHIKSRLNEGLTMRRSF